MANLVDLGKVAVTGGGVWNSATNYERLTFVLYENDGCGYVSLKNNIGVTPGTDASVWQRASQAGKSIYELCVQHGTFVGTEDEFVAQYNAAVAAAQQAARDTNATNQSVIAAEQGRVTAENGRVSAENTRVNAENGRVAAENGRVAAEENRVNEFSRSKAAADTAAENATTVATNVAAAEALRVTAENGRVTAEQGRVNAENGRVAAENARQAAQTHWRGQWESGGNYVANDIVFNNGSSFVCTTTGTQTEPTLSYDSSTGTWSASSGWDINSVGASAETVAKVADLETILSGLDAVLGQHETIDEVSLSAAISGKYVGTDGQLVTDASFSVSDAVRLSAGKIYLFKSTDAVGAGVSLFSKRVQHNDEVGIDYTFTYDEETGHPLTATAVYDSSLVYTYHYDEGGNLVNITDANDNVVATLPATRSVSYVTYVPLFFNGATIPDSGYYVYLCIEDADIVVSAKTADLAGGLAGALYDVFHAIALEIEDRIAKDGNEASAIAHIFALLSNRIDAIEDKIQNGFSKVIVDDLEVRNSLDDFSRYGNANRSGAGAPDFIPDKVGQRYFDTTNKVWYTAVGDSAVSNWKLDTNA